MSDSLNCNNNQIPYYSGITINITNPSTAFPPPPCVQKESGNVYNMTNPQAYINKGSYLEPIKDEHVNNELIENSNNLQIKKDERDVLPQTYPQQYYVNNYDYSQNNKSLNGTNQGERSVLNYNVAQNPEQNSANNVSALSQEKENNDNISEEVIQANDPVDTDTSQEIIEELEKRNAEQKELEKNGKKVKVVSLTNEYIMSLENYLNNPNTDIRLMASKEILTRLDEDKSRYDDAALNALLNKMLQDPNKLIRIAAMSAFSSELASGNEYTVQLLNQIQQNPNADPEDVLEASQILLKRSAATEVRYTPIVNREVQNVEMPIIQQVQKVQTQQ